MASYGSYRIGNAGQEGLYFHDRVFEIPTKVDLPTLGESASLYIIADVNELLHWDGSSYVNIGGSNGEQLIKVDTFADLPNTGSEKVLYIDIELSTMYHWEVDKYVKINNIEPSILTFINKAGFPTDGRINTIYIDEDTAKIYSFNDRNNSYNELNPHKDNVLLVNVLPSPNDVQANTLYILDTDLSLNLFMGGAWVRLNNESTTSDPSVLTRATFNDFPQTGSINTLYISENDNNLYRWQLETTISEGYEDITDNLVTVVTFSDIDSLSKSLDVIYHMTDTNKFGMWSGENKDWTILNISLETDISFVNTDVKGAISRSGDKGYGSNIFVISDDTRHMWVERYILAHYVNITEDTSTNDPKLFEYYNKNIMGWNKEIDYLQNGNINLYYKHDDQVIIISIVHDELGRVRFLEIRGDITEYEWLLKTIKYDNTNDLELVTGIDYSSKLSTRSILLKEKWDYSLNADGSKNGLLVETDDITIPDKHDKYGKLTYLKYPSTLGFINAVTFHKTDDTPERPDGNEYPAPMFKINALDDHKNAEVIFRMVHAGNSTQLGTVFRSAEPTPNKNWDCLQIQIVYGGTRLSGYTNVNSSWGLLPGFPVTPNPRSTAAQPYWYRMTFIGNKLTVYSSPDGIAWDMQQTVYDDSHQSGNLLIMLWVGLCDRSIEGVKVAHIAFTDIFARKLP